MKPNLSFEKIRSERLSDAVMSQIVELISRGVLRIGDRLPSERELIERFGVSRGSIREALRILETQGVLEIRPGAGTFVAIEGEQTRFIPGMVAWFREHRREVMDIMDVREAIETKAAFLAAKRISASELSRMRALNGEMQEHLEAARIEEATTSDRSFHRLLAEASGNELLVALADQMMRALSEHRHSVLASPKRAQISIYEHQEILAGLEAKDSEATQVAVITHIRSVKDSISTLASSNKETDD